MVEVEVKPGKTNNCFRCGKFTKGSNYCRSCAIITLNEVAPKIRKCRNCGAELMSHAVRPLCRSCRRLKSKRRKPWLPTYRFAERMHYLRSRAIAKLPLFPIPEELNPTLD